MKHTKPTVKMRCRKTGFRQRVVHMRRETVKRKQQTIQKKVKTQREGRCKPCADREASTRCADHKCKAPPDMQTSQSVQACLRREVPTDNEAHGQRSGDCR